MSKRRTDRNLEEVRDRAHRLAPDVESAFDNLNQEAANIAIITAQTSDTTGGSKGSHADAVVHAVLQRERIDDRRTAIRDGIATLKLAMTLLEEETRNGIRFRIEREARHDSHDDPARPRCIGDNTAAGATCWQIPSERRDHSTNQTIDDGRCIDCGTRHDQRRSRKAELERKRRHTGDAA